MLWWTRVNGRVADYGEAELSDRYLRVRLEDLCEAPKRTVRRLFEFVGSEAPMKPAVGEVMTPPSLGRWREHPEAEVACLTALGEDALRRFGYLSPS